MRNKYVPFLTLAMAVLVPASLFASGFGYYEHGAKATAMAGAFVGRADDVTAIFYNPAGIAFLEGTNIHFGMHPVSSDTKASFMGISTAGTTDTLYPASAYFSTPLTKNITFGFGFFIPFGLSTDWPHSWIGNRLSYHSAVRSYYFQPTIAYKVNDQLSIGAGLDIVRSKVELSQNNVTDIVISPLLPPLSIGIDTVIDVTGTGYGVNLGLLYKATPKFNIGFSYKSQISIDYEGDVEFTPTPTGISIVDAGINGIFADQGARLSLAMPQIFVVGTMYKAADNINLQFDLQWTGWSCVDKLALGFDNEMLDTELETLWEDAFTVRVGGEYMLDPFWALRAGYIYDQGAVPDATLSPLLPDSDRNELTCGIGYDTLESCCWGRMAIDLALQYIWFGDHTSTLSAFPAKYESNALIIGMGFTYSF
jgi:long-chain fatty acid transport protein